MSLPTRLIRRLLSPRRGSVLILVVALLLLMAIIGTAFISGARTDRYAAVQHNTNTQIDLLVQGVENLLSSGIVGKLFDSAGDFRPAATALAQYRSSYDSALSDSYLASRVPELISGTNTAMWRSTGMLPLTNPAITGTPAYELQDPAGNQVVLAWWYSAAAQANYVPGDVVAVVGAEPLIFYTPTTSGVSPVGIPGAVASAGWSVVELKQAYEFIPSSSPTSGRPALYVFDTLYTGAAGGYLKPTASSATPSLPTTYDTGNTNDLIGAADTDGDGIADAGLVKLPVGQLDGATYFAAVRVIDENSAVNASAAWTNATDVDSSANNYYLGMFKSDVGLQQMLATANAISGIEKLNSDRFGYSSHTTTPAVSSTPYTTSASTSTRSPSDFTFLTPGDAIDNELTNRPGNPAYNGGSGGIYQWFGSPLTASLANHFCLVPSTSSTANIAETDLTADLLTYSNYRSTPYSVTDVNTSATSAGIWFNNNFAYSSGVMPLRSLLVGSNPISDGVAGHCSAVAKWVTAPTLHTDAKYHFGDCVYITDVSGNPTYRFVCIQDHLPAVANEPTAAMATETWTLGGGGASADLYWAFVPWSSVPLKASATTAAFGQLWSAYWNVMWDHASTTLNGFAQPAFGYPRYTGDSSNQVSNQLITVSGLAARMFRSPIRDPSAAAGVSTAQYLTPGQTMLLRSALAAINTVALRNSTPCGAASATALENVFSRLITIPADPSDTNVHPAVDVMLFGATRQPYISEVSINSDPTPANDYVAIELTNPYPAPMPLTGWQLGEMDRSSAAAYAAMKINPPGGGAPYADLSTVTIPAATAAGPGLAVIYSGGAGAATPAHVTTPQNATNETIYASTTSPVTGATPLAAVNNLYLSIGKEIVMLRPRSAAGGLNGTLAAGNSPAYAENAYTNPYNETTAGVPYLAELVPVDQIDTVGLAGGAAATLYSYRRANDVTAAGGGNWCWVYPGVFTGTSPQHETGFNPVVGATPPDDLGGYKKPAIVAGTGTLSASPVTTTAELAVSSFGTTPIQVSNIDSAGGWNPVNSLGGNLFPFGGFARDGDLLQVPFIGGYRITLNSQAATPYTLNIMELNSLPTDSAFADDQDANDDATATDQTGAAAPTNFTEQIGRFCPIRNVTSYAAVDPAPTSQTLPDDYLPPTAVGPTLNSNNEWRYHWASNLFDFVTARVPSNDYLPNTDPTTYTAVDTTAAVPTAVANRKANIANAQSLAGASEDTVGVEGKININTAPWPVLAALPWFPGGATSDAKTPAITSTTLAQAIVYYRSLHGPYRSLFDLYKVVDLSGTAEFKTAADDLCLYVNASSAQALNAGDFTPYKDWVTGAVPYDFSNRFLMLNRVSNLITTRSDSFTCYVLVQGWRNVGSSNPTLVAQRRAAFILDRSGVTPNNPNGYTTFPISQN